MAGAYYNENDPKTAAWLRELIKAGLVAGGEVDTRSIKDVSPGDMRGYVQCHFFAGIGGWSYALRLAGWPDDRHVWTGSCPCQPFSQAASINGRKGFDDERHLWPAWRELIAQCCPATVFGEQSAAAADWLRLVRSDLEALGYAMGAMPIQAASVGADHERDRLWFVADTDGDWQSAVAFHAEAEATPIFAAHADSARLQGRGQAGTDSQNARDIAAWNRPCHDTASDLRRHRAHRPSLGSGVHGVPNRVGAVRGFGNAIVPQVAAVFIQAYLQARA